MKKNEIISMEITGMTNEGSGVGHYEGIVVFVPDSVVGDFLEVRIVKVNKTHSFGRMEKIVTPSIDRIKPDCMVSHRCGGCVFRHVSYEAELRYKQDFVQQNMQRIGGVTPIYEPIIPSPLINQYRNKAQYPIRLQKGQLCAGFFAPRSHEVVNCLNCKLQLPIFAELLEIILEFCKNKKITAYNEETRTGLLRHVYFRRGTYSQEIMICLVCNDIEFPFADELLTELQKASSKIVSVLCNVNKQNTNVILGNQTYIIFGKSTINDSMCDLNFALSPQAFYQVNTIAAEKLYAIATEYANLTGQETILDLYCGVGTIGLSMAKNVKEIIGVEIVPESVENAIANAAANNISNASFFCADASEAAYRLANEGKHPDVIILDPPRKGCDEKTLYAVAQMLPSRIVYISCNSATLARDCAILKLLGYEAKRCRPVDLFPRTAHVEVVVSMCRKDT